MIFWLFLAALIALAFNNSWWWIIVTLAALIKVSRWWIYNSSPWRKIHYPAMRIYAGAAGIESSTAEKSGRIFDVRNALITLVNIQRPNWKEEKSIQFVDRELENARYFKNEKLVRDTIRKRNTKISNSELDESMNIINEGIDFNDNSWLVRGVISGLIEDQFSKDDRGEYLVECITGTAK